MTLFDAFVQYSGWATSILSFAYIGVQRVEARKERRQRDKLTELLARINTSPTLVGGDKPRTTPRPPDHRNERLRGALIRAAAGGQQIDRAYRSVERRYGYSEAEILSAAQALRDSGLLEFEPPLTLATIPTLKV